MWLYRKEDYMSVLKYLDKIIDADPERFLKFISNGCDYIRFEDSCCISCPMKDPNKGCIFAEKIPVVPEDWSFNMDETPKSEKDCSKLFTRRHKIHVSYVMNIFKDEDAEAIKEPEPFTEPVIPSSIANYIKTYNEIRKKLKFEVNRKYLYVYNSDENLFEINEEVANIIRSLEFPNFFTAKYYRDCIDKQHLLYKIMPVSWEQCSSTYKFLTTTEDIESYLERDSVHTFIKDYEDGAFGMTDAYRASLTDRSGL